MNTLYSLWFSFLGVVTRAWLYLSTLTNWKALFLAVVAQLIVSVVFYWLFVAIFGFPVPRFFKFLINVGTMFWLFIYFQRRFSVVER